MTGIQPPDGPEQRPMFPQAAAPPPPPQGYPSYPSAPPGRAYSLGGISVATMILLGVATVGAVVMAFPLFNRANLAENFFSSRDLGELEDADAAVAGGLLLFGLATLVTGILFMIWQFRYASNAATLGGPLSLGPGWAIGGWFIPVASFILPGLQLRQSAKASGGVPALVTAWQVGWALAGLSFAGASVNRPDQNDTFLRPSDALQAFARADRIAGGSMIVYAITGVLALLMVRTLTQAQERAAGPRWGEPTTQGQWAQPPPPQWGEQAPQQWAQPATPPPPPAQQPWGPPPPADPRWDRPQD
ncbi:MAG: DUF4328 domain-containing protein [Kibdelosporangium sp.]